MRRTDNNNLMKIIEKDYIRIKWAFNSPYDRVFHYVYAWANSDESILEERDGAVTAYLTNGTTHRRSSEVLVFG